MVKRALGKKAAVQRPDTSTEPTSRNADTSLVEQTGQAVANLGKSQDRAKQKTSVRLDPDVVVRLTNPRVVYCTYDDIRRTNWPALDTDAEKLEEKLLTALNSQEWFTKLSTVERARAKDFFIGIHELSCSIYFHSQLQPIVLERDDPTLMEGRLLAGERRLMAVIYSKGWIPSVSAEIYNYRLSELERAVIRDQENAKADLSVYEIIRSKEAVFRNLEDAEGLPLSKLASALGYRTVSMPSILRRLFALKNFEEVMRVIWLENSGWRRVDELLKIATELPENITALLRKLDSQKDSPTAASHKTKAKPQSAGNNTKKELKKYGLTVGKRTDTSVARKIIELAMSSGAMPKSAKEELKGVDLSTVEGLEKAWLVLAEIFAGEQDNG